MITRREWLRISSLAGLGLTAPFSRSVRGTSASSGATGFGKAKSVILVYTSGGQSQLDTWDPKPDAPREIRGDFRPIDTTIAGVRICEHLSQVARAANLFTIVRSVSHEDLDHGSATYLTMTGNYHVRRSGNPPIDPANDLPTYGSVLHRVRPGGKLPFTAVHVNGPLQVPTFLAPGQFAGRLGSSCEPLLIGDPTQKNGAVCGMENLADLPPVRQHARQTLLESLDQYSQRMQQNRALLDLDEKYRQAHELLSSQHGRRAFDLEREPEAVRDRYGRHRSGQACLLARRLVEAGIPWITVIWNHTCRGQDKDPAQTDVYGWDTHNDIFGALKEHLLPRFDQSFSALLTDLDQRGLLDQTLVVCMGEFGRHPQLGMESSFPGNSPGRKHWPACYSVVMAGAGVRRGTTFGASDRNAAYPHSKPVGPWDLAATMFHTLGVDPGAHYLDASKRPFPVTVGTPILGLFG
jgi:hypothetical protein